MLIIDIKGGNIEGALKQYKKKVQSTKQIEELRKRQEYVKKTTVKREKMKKAKYKQAMMNKLGD